MSLEVQGIQGLVAHGRNDFVRAGLLKDTAVDDAEGIDELLFEGLVLQHVQEDVDEKVLACVVARIFKTTFQVAYHVGRAEARIQVHEDEVEFAVGPRAIALDVVAVGKPVLTTDVAFCCHVVAIFVDVYQFTYLLIDGIVGGVIGQFLG